jgi:hypothetical protein
MSDTQLKQPETASGRERERAPPGSVNFHAAQATAAPVVTPPARLVEKHRLKRGEILIT